MDSTKYKSPGLTYLLTYWCSIIDYHQGGVLELIQYSAYWLIILLSAVRQRSAHGCTQTKTYLLTYWCSIIDYHQGGVLELIQFSTYWLIILLSADRQRSAHGCTQAESIADAFPNRKQGPALFLKGFV